MTKDKYEELKRQGICVSCRSKKAVEGRVKCSECAEIDKKRQSDNRKFFKQLGFCYRCGKNQLFGDEKICPECLAKASKYKNNKETSRIYYQRWKTKLKEQGLCLNCGKREVSQGKTYCEICLRKRKQMRADYRRNKGIDERAERFYCNQCYICGNKVENGNKLCSKCKQRAINNLKPADKTNHVWKSDNKLIRSKNYGEKVSIS